MKRSKPALKNRILTVAGAVLLVALSVFSIQKTFVSAVALEQTARCGAEEHHHETDCYVDGKLSCGQKEHTHNRNCYLVLLKDNDINDLLSHIDNDQSHSLEMLIYRTVDTAIHYNSNLTVVDADANSGVGTVFLANTAVNTPVQEETLTEAETQTAATQVEYSSVPAAVSMQDVDISALNETISENEIEPNIVLNEDLYDATTLSSTPTDTVALLGDISSSSGVSPLSVGDTAQGGSRQANFYIALDRSSNWVCIGTLTFDTVENNNDYFTARIETEEILDLINGSLGTSFTSTNFNLRYATSANANSWSWSTAEKGTTYTTFGTNYRREDSAAQAKYIRIVNSSNSAIVFYTVTLRYSDDTEDIKYIQSGTQITLPEGCDWTSGSRTYSGGDAVRITGTTTFDAVGPVTYYTVTYQYPDGTSTTDTVAGGSQITLPRGYVWTVNGSSYDGGESIKINADTTIVGAFAPVQVSYSVNFPMSGYESGGNMQEVIKPSASPTVEGMSGAAGSVNVPPQQSVTVRTVSQTMVNLTTKHNSYKTYDYPVLFRGWRSETGELISAHSQLSWEELRGYDENMDGTVTLTGEWEHGLTTTASFFILLNSSVDQMSSNDVADYTDVIFSTYIGNATTGSVGRNPYNATSDAAALENDAKIRAMHGEHSEDIWFYTFPRDEDIFASLKTYAEGRDLKVGSEMVAVEDLNSNEYAIRWYKVLSEGDGWHVDGKLTRKVGAIEVSKTFAGNDTLIDDAKSGFRITANNGSRTVILDSANDIDDGDGNPNTWFWRIENVKYNEVWTLTEVPNTSDDTIHHAEWSVSDASVNSQTGNGTGNIVTVRGVTYASDLADPEWLQVNFNNIYYHKDSLMIKKADGVTGEALSGATFRLYQNDVLMTFDYDSNSGMYVYNPDDTGAYDTLTGNGYMNIAAKDFSYDNGPITVREITAPTNYNPVGDIKVGYTDTGQVNIGIIDPVDYATYLDGLLVVYNSANTMSVTAEKIWECEESEWRDIKVQLFANDSANLAATLTGTQSTMVGLTADNDYSYTWADLPIYAYGSKVEWSIKEIQIGNEACKADYTFANWAVSYDAAVYDADGNATLAVHNTPSRPLLYLTKTNADGSEQLGGATFSLVQVNAGGSPVDGFVTRTATTNAQGLLIFDNLLYGVRYRIVEESAPPGYRLLTDPIYLTIAEGGVVEVESHGNAKADAVAYNVVVTNISYPPLPETGGSGPGVSYGLGGAMMLLAACGYILLKTEKRGRHQSG